MARHNSYNTRQGDAVLNYVSSLGGKHATVDEISAHFAKSGRSVGVTTIYRQLEKLKQSGKVRKLIIDGISGACYQYVGELEADSLRLKCDRCGKLYSLECGEADNLGRHILKSHKFRIDPAKTVFYGECDSCQDVK
jgi:Fur family ferric uptake transcriptional regulator